MFMPLIWIKLIRMALVITASAILLLAVLPPTELGIATLNDKLAHVAAFVTLALLLDFAFPRQGLGLSKIAVLIAYGMLIEGIQYFLPLREASIADLLANATGIVLYALMVPGLRYCPLLQRRWL